MFKRSMSLSLSLGIILTTLVILPSSGLRSVQASEGSVPVFKPQVTGAPTRRVGGGSRGTGDQIPYLAVLAPESTGQTISSQPSLYWAVSKKVDKPIKFTLVYAEMSLGTEPLLELSLNSSQGGIQGIHLADYNLILKPGIEYQWSISISTDSTQPSSDIVSSGTIKRIEIPVGLSEKLNQANEKQHPFIYAEKGLWYDAIESLSKLIIKEPKNKILSQQRAALLEQVGLRAAIGGDRHS